MKTFLYVRVSTAEQASSGDSLATQQQQAAGYCMMKGWEITAAFLEAGVSGSVPFAERPEGAKLLAAVRKGDAIIVPKLDRAFRNAADALATLEALKEQGVSLHVLDLGGDVTGNGIGKLTFTILAAVAESERDRIRERIRDVKQHLRGQGVYGGGKVPFGFEVIEGRLVPVPEQQEALKDMRARRDAGESFAAIGAAYGKTAMTVKRILDRGEVHSFSADAR